MHAPPRLAIRLAAATAMASLALGQASGQERPTRSDVWTLDLGMQAAAIPDEFVDYACGTDGGPPSLPLSHFAAFAQCPPEPNGLREVYFRYDDELEYWARALELDQEVSRYSGTQMFNFPVVLSLLFDAKGIVRGIRIVTDPRDDSRSRAEFWTLENFFLARFGQDGWSCTDLPPAEGETPVGTRFEKRKCTKTVNNDRRLTVQTRYLRRKGQAAYDPHTRELRQDDFESVARLDIVSLSVLEKP